ncbi:MAG: archease [Candidatus Eisenbacteria bacterium]|nr:archease [Candidatus Eisenbacteria bacterium]
MKNGTDRESARWLEHDADVLLEVTALSRERLFALAAETLARSMLDEDPPSGSSRRTVRLAGDDPEALLVSWLNEVIYLVTGRVFFPSAVRRVAISEGAMTAEIGGIEGGPRFPSLAREVKAATFHGLEIVEKSGTWRAVILFDV